MAIYVSILNGGTNNHPTTSEEANHLTTDFVGEGVVGNIGNTGNLAPMTGSFAVNAQGTPDMTVAVTAGSAYVEATPSGQNSQILRAKLSSDENVTISANSSGSTKYDWVYLKVDATTANEPNLAGDDVGSLVTSRSTNNTSDDGTPPTYGILLAVVTVANGASSITDGNIRDNRSQSTITTTSGTTAGWTDLADDLEFTSNDGNKQATYSITGVDKTGTIQEGMKVKLPRVTTVGTQCADLEASSSQYASKSSPSGCTFTDDFTCGGWVKLESIGSDQEVITRFNSTGFLYRVNSDGLFRLSGTGGSGTDIIQSYQSLPVGEWVHIVGTLNMSASTGTLYLNGVEVTAAYTDSGSTSLTQAGNLVLGAYASGSNPFDGKLKHVFVANKVLSEAKVQEAMVSDALETSSFSANLVAYYKTENDFTDDSGNSNDLTAQNSAVATDTDSPFSSTEYGIITSATFSTDTTAVIDFGSKVPVNENVTAPAYSTHNVPYGFPINVEHQQTEQTANGGAYVGTFTTNGSTGNQSITGLGFKPKAVMFNIGFATGVSSTANEGHGTGFMDSNGNQNASWGVSRETHGGASLQGTGFCFIASTVNTGGGSQNVSTKGAYVSMDTDGFTVDIQTATSQLIVGFLAIG